MLVRRSVRPLRDCVKKIQKKICKEKSHKIILFHVCVGVPFSNRLRWKFAHRYRLLTLSIVWIFVAVVKGFGFCEGSNIGFSHRKLTWPIRHCLALPRWHVILFPINMKNNITCSALALCKVLGMTSLSYGNMPFSGTNPTKAPWPIVLKFCTIDYVGETTKHAKNDYNRMGRGGSPYRWNISIYHCQKLSQLLTVCNGHNRVNDT
jgi:hypothetical protein